jgi:hypothetical protein
MNIFDKEFIKSLAREIARPILEAMQDFLKRQDDKKQSQTGLIPQSVVLEELDIDWGTLDKWEGKGLQRYEPPIEDTRKVYYDKDEIRKFLSLK